MSPGLVINFDLEPHTFRVALINFKMSSSTGRGHRGVRCLSDHRGLIFIIPWGSRTRRERDFDEYPFEKQINPTRVYRSSGLDMTRTQCRLY